MTALGTVILSGVKDLGSWFWGSDGYQQLRRSYAPLRMTCFLCSPRFRRVPSRSAPFHPRPGRDPWRVAVLLACVTIMASGCGRRHSAPQAYAAFVANNESSTVAEVDLASFRVRASVPVAARPERIVVRPQSEELWVVTGSGEISVVEFPALRVQKNLPIEQGARDLTFSSSGRQGFLLEPERGQIVFIDAQTHKEITRLSLGAALSDLVLTPDGNTLVASSGATNQIFFVKVDSRQVLGTVKVGRGPGPMVVLPNSSKVFVCDTEEPALSAVDVSTRQLLANIEMAIRPGAMVLKPDGGELFVFEEDGTRMVIVDTEQNNVEQNYPTGHKAVAGVFERDPLILYLANAGDGSVMALDVQNRTLLAAVHIGIEPRALALTPDERFLAVADTSASTLAVLQTNPTTLLTSFPVGARPVDVVVPGWVIQ